MASLFLRRWLYIYLTLNYFQYKNCLTPSKDYLRQVESKWLSSKWLTYMLGFPCFIYHSKLVIKSCSHHFIDKKRKPREKFLGMPGQGRALYPGTFTTTIFSTQHAAVFSGCNLNDNLKFVLRQMPLLLLYCINNKMC